VVSTVYEILGLEMSFKPTQTECFLKYRGVNRVSCREARRVGPEGSMAVEIPDTDPPVLVRIVNSYKHLGSVATDNGSLYLDAKHKKANAMQAYAPLSSKIFGSPEVPLQMKMSFLWSLVLSRLLFGCHIYVPSPRYVRELTAVYMRAVRRIFQCPRFGPVETDAAMRKRAKLPSVDCLLCRGRLRFLARLVRSQPPHVISFLSVRFKTKPLPWVELIRSDVDRMRLTVSLCSYLPDPSDSSAWCRMMIDQPAQWANAVSAIHFTESMGDPPSSGLHDDPHVLPHVCGDCQTAFPTSRALGSHRRIAHKVLAPQRLFAPANGVCPCCGTRFLSHLRLLAHLCDARRPKCWDAIRVQPSLRLPLHVVKQLDCEDNVSRLAARRAGHSHDLAVGSAMRANGSVVGRATR
jgi:hypothetical protein